MKWQKEMLDLFLVPAGLFLMFGYHIFLVYRYLRNYTCTVLGFHNHCQKVWVKKLMQANLFLSMPKAAVPEDFIVEALVHGANFWQVGLRAIYFAITMLMWIFGPIPMFLSSAAMVAVLYVLDVNNKILDDFNESSEKEEERNEAVVGGCEKQEILDDGSSELQAAAALTTALLSTAFASL